MMKKRVLWLSIAAALIVLVGGVFLGWRLLTQAFVRRYYQESYAPIPLPQGLGAPPPAHMLDDVPWIAADQPVCQSTSLQMIAAQRGIEQPRTTYDFLMGFTYGATDVTGSGFYPFGTDPEVGLATAAPYVGLERRYYVTDDAAAYLQGLRHYIAQGYPVRLALDIGVLYGVEDRIPHSEVVVGYDEGGFTYYETVCVPPATCQPGQQPAGAEGIHVTDERLLDAVLAQARQFSYPWRYALTVFYPGPTATDLHPVWTRNGEALRGGVQYGPRQGADAIDGLADRVEKRRRNIDYADLAYTMDVMACLCEDNAHFLRETFPGEGNAEQAASAFEQVVDDCRAVRDALADGIADQAEAERIAVHLRDAAAAERRAGELFLARGQ